MQTKTGGTTTGGRCCIKLLIVQDLRLRGLVDELVLYQPDVFGLEQKRMLCSKNATIEEMGCMPEQVWQQRC